MWVNRPRITFRWAITTQDWERIADRSMIIGNEKWTLATGGGGFSDENTFTLNYSERG